jgi:YihY family inner membrane protein
VSTATLVPETWELTGDDARATLTRTGRRRLLADSFRRLRVADGFSHARSLAFMTTLVLVQGVIAVVGLASAAGGTGVSDVIVNAIHGSVPGPAGQVLTTAVQQAQGAGLSRRYLALILGTIGMLVSATTAMGQVERALNRIYGVEQDRPFTHKYGFAFVLALSSGSLAALAFVALAQGRAVGDSLDNHVVSTIWGWSRWPLAVVLIALAVTLLFRWCPRRHQPGLSWLAYGASLSVLGWIIVTLGLEAVFTSSSSFGDTYGPLAGLVGLMLWALLSAIAVLFGAAAAAQLEAIRAGAPRPQDEQKVAESEPDAGDDAGFNSAVETVGAR